MTGKNGIWIRECAPRTALWWESYGEEYKELQKLAIRVLSLTCSATRCERNWSTFDHVHSKKRNRLEQQRLNALVFVKYNIQLELRQIKRQERGETYDPIYLLDMKSDDEWITEKEDPCLPEDHSWMDIQECFEDDEGTTSSKKRKRGPRNLNATDRGKRKVFKDDDEVELIEGGEEEEEEEFNEVTMVDDDEDDIDLGDDED
ncbi:pheromone-processing carboxypeptidase KEX1-like isoform X5 [Camellia sinensis]|uniref:pheromone-processing carboxypeptidase KEX1-like isoform X5 n=1 Tax=Camellia sinensis TaxID=4442 RepID=UPI001035D436|nr:pheromone-processing carboxypeptidase KEX1-like isoform X5 [Camellia sinensis]